MDQTTTQQAPTMTLQKDLLTQSPAAFEPKLSEDEKQGQLSRVLASSFLKYCEKADHLLQADSVESFIQLHQLYTEIAEQAADFLADEVQFTKANYPINDLLLRFANYRLSRASRAYYYETLISRESEESARLRDMVKACQQDFDRFIQAV